MKLTQKRKDAKKAKSWLANSFGTGPALSAANPNFDFHHFANDDFAMGGDNRRCGPVPN